MKIEVLGTGCAKCTKLFEQVKAAVNDAGIVATVEKVEKIEEIMKRGVMLTPGLVIDGQVVSSGKVPKPADILKLLQNAASRS